MTAKPAGPLCMFVCVITVFSESLPMDVLHSHSIYLSSRSMCFPVPPPLTFLSQLSLSPLSLVSFVLLNAAFFYPASHRYSAKWLRFPPHQRIFHRFVDANFASQVFVQSFAFDTISIFPPHISIVLLPPFSKTFL